MNSDNIRNDHHEKYTYEKRIYQLFILSFVGLFTVLYLFTFQWGPYLWRRFTLYREKRQALKEVLDKKYDDPSSLEVEKSNKNININNSNNKDKILNIPTKFSFKKKIVSVDNEKDKKNNNLVPKSEANKVKKILPNNSPVVKQSDGNMNNNNNSNNNRTSQPIYSNSANISYNHIDYVQSDINNIRNLRSRQDEEYLESLREDEKKKEKILFEKQIKEAERLSLLLELKRKEDLIEKVNLSINNSEINESITLLFKTPNINNKKVNLKRKFSVNSTVLNILEYLEVYLLINNNIENIGIDKIEVMEGAPPRRLLTSLPYETTLEELLIVSNSVLWVTLKE